MDPGDTMDNQILRAANDALAAEILSLRAELTEAMESLEMSCTEPLDSCECPGCLYAADVHRGHP